jgi:hypothetical protein
MKQSATPQGHSDWYRYGVMFIAFEAMIAILQTAYAIYMVLSGAGGPGGAH